jgi:hypothetical protein
LDSDGKDYTWCEGRVDSLGRDIDGNTFEVTHLCRHGEEHEGPHKCGFCSVTWEESEVPC